MDALWILAAGASGLIFGAGLTWLSVRARLIERGRLDGELRQAREGRAIAETKAARVDELQATLAVREEEAWTLREELARQSAYVEAERASIQDQRDLLEHHVEKTFASLSANALERTNRAFLELATETFSKYNERAKGELEKKQQAIQELVKPIAEKLSEFDASVKGMEKERVGAYEQLKEQVTKLAEGHSKLQSETNNLVRALRNPQQRGRWGEIQLETILKMAGLEEGVHFRRQEYRAVEDGAVQPDTVVFLPTGREVVIDSKAPLEAYLDAQDCVDEDARTQKLKDHARQVKTHIQNLTRKAYWDRFESADFVIMFLPGESLFSAAVQHDATLLEFGVENKVFIASPMTLITMLRSVAMGWRQERLAENAKKISDEAKELYARIGNVLDPIRTLGMRLDSAVKSYNDAVASIDTRLIPQARKLKELHATTAADLHDLSPIEKATRRVQSQEFRAIVASIDEESSREARPQAEALIDDLAETSAVTPKLEG